VTSQAAFGPPFFRNEGDAPLHRAFDLRESRFVAMMKGCVPSAAAVVAALLCGCATERAYEGPPLAKGEVAIVRADPVVSAGAPVQVRIRQVDGRDVGLSASKVELPPGAHAIVVDCRVAESGSLRRFTVEATLDAGGRYRLVANTTARNCESVELIAD
jgi:hypothetical protein